MLTQVEQLNGNIKDITLTPAQIKSLEDVIPFVT